MKILERRVNKTYTKLLAIHVLVFLITLSSMGQSTDYVSFNPTLDNVFPPSPNAAALGKFTDIPVSPATGIPSISVPVYNYSNKSNGLNLNISLDYHAGGIRVDEMASNVGIGWALNCGGVISRTVRGIYDEMYGIGFMNAPALPQTEMDGNAPTSIHDRPYTKIYNSQLDGQSDIFSFNFNGRNGKFQFGKNNDFLMINEQRLKVEKVIENYLGNTMITQFTITDEFGYIYVFDAFEVTLNSSIYQSSPTASKYISSWYLSKIYTPSKKAYISFSYENTDYEYASGRSFSETVLIAGKTGWPPGKPYAASIHSQRINGKRIKTVIFPEGHTITFNYDTQERTDLPRDHLLKEILVRDNTNQKGVRLVQDYSLNRATLKKVIPIGGNAKIEDAAYQFEYGITLPDRLSTKQDHWGYYNNNTGSFIPQEYYAMASMTLGGGNRDTDAYKVKAGSIQKVIYPTGGYTVYELEANKAKDGPYRYASTEKYVGGLRARCIKTYDGVSANPVLIKEFEYLKDDGTTSSGSISLDPVYSEAVFYDERINVYSHGSVEYYAAYSSPNYISRSSSSLFTLVCASGSPVTYEKVREKTIDHNGNSLGYIDRYFTFFGSSVLYLTPFPYTPPVFKDWEYGLLKDEIVYNGNSDTIKITNYEYNYNNTLLSGTRLENFRSITLAPVKYATDDSNPFWSLPCYFLSNNFYPYPGWVHPSSVTTTEKFPSGNVTTTVTYEYDPDYYYKMSETTTNSANEIVKTEFVYPKNMVDANRDPNNIYSSMINLNQNIINRVVEEKQYVGSTLVNSVLKNYYKPYIGVYVPQTVDILGEPRLRYHQYDDGGRLLTASKENGTPITYIWGYNKTLPVVKIEGMDYASVSTVIKNSVESHVFTGNTNTDVGYLKTAIFGSLSSTGCMFTFYTYSPLFGITSQTDTNGVTTYYEYDDFGRLKLVRDQNRNIISKNEYHYVSQ